MLRWATIVQSRPAASRAFTSVILMPWIRSMVNTRRVVVSQ